MIVTKSNAVIHSRDGVFGRYYQLPETSGGTTVAYAVFTGEHGQRTIGERPRIYYLLSGSCEFMINDKKFTANEGDLVEVPPHATYNLWPKSDVIKVMLYMELLDVSKLPK